MNATLRSFLLVSFACLSLSSLPLAAASLSPNAPGNTPSSPSSSDATPLAPSDVHYRVTATLRDPQAVSN